MTDLSVVVPTTGEGGRPLALLERLSRQDPGGHALEILLVDDGGRTGTLSPPALPFPVRVLKHPVNRGRAAACNTGAGAARGRILLFLDDDLEPLGPDLLSGHLRTHEGAAPRAVMGRVEIAPSTRPGPWGGFLRDDVRRVNRLRTEASDLGGRMLCETGNFSLPRNLFLQAGGFDEGFRLYGLEDIELGLRLARGGIPIVFRPELHTLHHTDTDTLTVVARKSFQRGRNAPRLAALYPEQADALGVAPYRDRSLRARAAVPVHLGLYPAWIAVAHVASWAGARRLRDRACHRVAFTWRMRGILAALR